MHPTANINSGPEAFEELFFEVFEGFDTGLARGFPKASPSPSPVPTDNAAEVAHDLDIESVLARGEARSVIRPSTCHEMAPYPHSHRLGWWSPVPVTRELLGLNDTPEARESEEEVSEEEETESEDELRPSQMAMKKPVGAWGPAATGQGERSPLEGIPIADAPEEQEGEVEDEEVAPAPVVANRKASAWSAEEDAACIRLMKEVCTQATYAAIASTEKRFEVVANRMKREAGFDRTASGVKIQWNRRLREASKFEDRGEKKRASGLTTSALGQGTKRVTSAGTSLVAAPSSGTNISSSPAPSTETRQSIRNGKRKATLIDSDDDDDNDDDDDFLPAPRLSKPSKRVRSTSDASSSAVPSTQDVAYYALSTENIISGTRSSRHRRAPSVEASSIIKPARLSRQQPSASNNVTRPISPEPAPNSKAYWEKKLRDRQAALAKQREEVERERQAQQDDDDEDEDPVISTAEKAKKGREYRKQFPNAMNSVFKSPSPANSPQPAGPLSPVKFTPTTKSSSAATKSSPATSSFSIANPFAANMPAGMARPRIYTSTRPFTTGRSSSTVEPTSNMRPSLSGRLLGSGIFHSDTRPSSTTTSSSTVDNDNSTTQPEYRSQRSSSDYRRLGEPHRRNRRPALFPIAEQTEHSFYPYEDEDSSIIRGPRDADTTQISNDEELARQLHEEMNGPPSRSRRGRGFR